MKRVFLAATLLILQGCAPLNRASLSSNASPGSYNPLTLESVDANKYKADKQQCYKQVEAETETSMMEHYNIIKFRDCLVKKGYVLMSVAPRLPYQIAGPLTQHLVRSERLTPAYI
jgi:hypothetical protein